MESRLRARSVGLQSPDLDRHAVSGAASQGLQAPASLLASLRAPPVVRSSLGLLQLYLWLSSLLFFLPLSSSLILPLHSHNGPEHQPPDTHVKLCLSIQVSLLHSRPGNSTCSSQVYPGWGCHPSTALPALSQPPWQQACPFWSVA